MSVNTRPTIEDRIALLVFGTGLLTGTETGVVTGGAIQVTVVSQDLADDA